MIPLLKVLLLAHLVYTDLNHSAKPAVWGFYPHKMINRMAVFTLPPALIAFYKPNIYLISTLAVQADRRRYAVAAEAPRHYMDLDFYGSEVAKMWAEAQLAYPQDSLHAHGILPWHLVKVKHQLTRAFVEKDLEAIISLSADAGHYLADAHVPLHTTSNYNGQKTDQVGIHGFWETRVPELLWEEFDLWVGKAVYWEHYSDEIWEILWDSHACVPLLLRSEKELSRSYDSDKKFTYEVRNSQNIRVYSPGYTRDYHRLIRSQVEKRLRLAIKRVGDFWYTCWVDAGQPDLGGEVAVLPDSLVLKLDKLWRNHQVPRNTMHKK